MNRLLKKIVMLFSLILLEEGVICLANRERGHKASTRVLWRIFIKNFLKIGTLPLYSEVKLRHVRCPLKDEKIFAPLPPPPHTWKCVYKKAGYLKCLSRSWTLVNFKVLLHKKNTLLWYGLICMLFNFSIFLFHFS